MNRFVLILLSLFAVSCSSPGGIMLGNGRITPCPDWHTDNDACGHAIFNANVINQVKLGETQDQVRTIMRHDAERREASSSLEGKNLETWSYITDYQAELMTTLTFTDGVLTAIGQAPWKSE
jgi:hypothetical protein